MSEPAITAEEFERRWVSSVRLTVEQLHLEWGRWAVPCNCDHEDCRGWAMGHQWEDAIVEDQIRGLAAAS